MVTKKNLINNFLDIVNCYDQHKSDLIYYSYYYRPVYVGSFTEVQNDRINGVSIIINDETDENIVLSKLDYTHYDSFFELEKFKKIIERLKENIFEYIEDEKDLSFDQKVFYESCIEDLSKYLNVDDLSDVNFEELCDMFNSWWDDTLFNSLDVYALIYVPEFYGFYLDLDSLKKDLPKDCYTFYEGKSIFNSDLKPLIENIKTYKLDNTDIDETIATKLEMIQSKSKKDMFELYKFIANQIENDVKGSLCYLTQNPLDYYNYTICVRLKKGFYVYVYIFEDKYIIRYSDNIKDTCESYSNMTKILRNVDFIPTNYYKEVYSLKMIKELLLSYYNNCSVKTVFYNVLSVGNLEIVYADKFFVILEGSKILKINENIDEFIKDVDPFLKFSSK